MSIHEKQCVYVAAVLMTAFGCGHVVSNPDGDDGPASSAAGAASSAGRSSSGSAGSTGGVASASATAGSSAAGGASTASAGGGSGNRDCRLPSAQDLAIDNPQSKSEVMFNDVLAEHLELLYESIGRYASGQTPLFRGQLRGLEDRTATGSDEILTMNTTRAVASLAYEEGLGDVPPAVGHVLTAFDPDARLTVRLIQDSGPVRTYVSPIGSFFSGGGIYASCSGCLLDLAGVQGEISFNLSAHGQYLNADATPMQVDVEGHLSRIPVDAITLEDILIATSVRGSPFHNVASRKDAGYVVFDKTGSVGSGRDANGCSLTTYYKLEWFVRESCLLDYGVRNLVINDASPNCSQDG